MAVTSAMSAELIAVSSVWTYDIYRIYTNPEATSTALVSKSHYAIVIFAYFIAGFSTILSYAGISMGYLYLIMGVLISSAVLPIALTVLWKRMNWYAAVFSPILGVILSVSSWLGKAKSEFGTLSISSTGSNTPVLIGNLVALLSPIAFVGILTALKPANEDFQSMRAIELIEEPQSSLAAGGEVYPNGHGPIGLRREELLEAANQLTQASRHAKLIALALTIALLVLWPMPMYGTGYIFSLNFFTAWVAIGILWIFFSLFGFSLLF